MAEPKDIGKAFKEKLKDFDQSSSNLTWKDIEPMLPKKERNRLSYFAKVSGILALLFLLTFYIYNHSENIKTKDTLDNPITETIIAQEDCPETIEEKSNQTHHIDEEKNTVSKIEESTPNIVNAVDHSIKNRPSYTNKSDYDPKRRGKKNNTNLSSNTTNTSRSASTYKNNTSRNNISELKRKKTQETNQEKIYNNSEVNKNSTTSLLPNPQETQQNEKLIGEHTEKLKDSATSKEVESITNRKKKDTLVYMHPNKKKDSQKFSLGLHLIPTYSITSKGSLLSDLLVDNKNTGRISLGYGILFKTYFSDKIALRVSYNRLKFINSTKDILPSELPAYIRNEWSLQTSNEVIENSGEIDLIQKLVYDEISMGLQYKIIDKKITTSLIGGFNFAFFNKNHINLKTSLAGDFDIRNENNIRKIGLGFHFGSNLKYELSEKLFLDIDPLINYQFKDASKNLDSYNLFYFTIQTGFSYEF